jgi:hypothetical protein
MDLDELGYLAIKVEKEMKMKSSTRLCGFMGYSSGWKSNYMREGSVLSK